MSVDLLKYNDYKEGDLIVSLKGDDAGKVSIAGWFECRHIPGNFRKLTEKDRITLDTDAETLKLAKIYENIQTLSLKD